MEGKKGKWPATVREWTVAGLLNEFIRIHRTMEDRSFAFLLGAGASVSSGIPSGAMLAKQWIEELYAQDIRDSSEVPLEEWVAAGNLRIPGLVFDDVGRFYAEIYERRFSDDPESGQAYLESKVIGKEPGVGYAILARILAITRHRVVITTNFDNLVADGLVIYTTERPLILGHETMTTLTQWKPRHPLIAKIHRDVFLGPLSDPSSISQLENEWRPLLRELLSKHIPIVLGYGGNDGSLMGLLEELDPGHIRGGIYWCFRQKDGIPSKRICDLVRKHAGKLVRIVGFDEFMIQLGERMGFDQLGKHVERQARERAQRYRKQYDRCQSALAEAGSVPKSEKQALELGVGKSLSADRRELNWRIWNQKALAQPSPEGSIELYEQGLKQFPRSAELTASYADFMLSRLKNLDSAEQLYRSALTLKPRDPILLDRLASFLHYDRRNYEESEEMYRKAIDAGPASGITLCNYANFLAEVRRNHDEAEALYQRALELDPQNGITMGNYANFVRRIRKDFDKAERLYKRAIELSPSQAHTIGNYGQFMKTVRRDYDKAERLYNRALELDPDHAKHISNLAILLYEIRKRPDEAERMFLQALKLEPRNPGIMCNYAVFQNRARHDITKAEEYFRESLSVEPDNAHAAGSLAALLNQQRRNPQEVEELFELALKSDPDDAHSICNYARFLEQIKCDYDTAELLFRRAAEIDPRNSYCLSGLAIFLTEIRKLHDEAESYFERAVRSNPQDARCLGEYATFKRNVRSEVDEAEQLWRRSIEADPDYAHSIFNLAILLWRDRRKHDEAEELFKQGVHLAQENSHFLAFYARFLWLVRDNLEEAEPFFLKAAELPAVSPYASRNFAAFLWRARGLVDDAEELFSRTVRDNPDDIDSRVSYGEFLIVQGRFPEAKPHLLHAWKLNQHEKTEAAAVVIFYWALGKRLSGSDDSEALACLKFLLLAGFPRWDWVMPSTLPSLIVELGADGEILYLALANAIRDAQEISKLDELAQWKVIVPIPIDVEWEIDVDEFDQEQER